MLLYKYFPEPGEAIFKNILDIAGISLKTKEKLYLTNNSGITSKKKQLSYHEVIFKRF